MLHHTYFYEYEECELTPLRLNPFGTIEGDDGTEIFPFCDFYDNLFNLAVECYPYNETACIGNPSSGGVNGGGITCLLSQLCDCTKDNPIATYIFQLAPILYPFSIEFSILVGE